MNKPTEKPSNASQKEKKHKERLRKTARAAFGGDLVRKDLARELTGRFPVPSYAAEAVLADCHREAGSWREAAEEARALLAEKVPAPGEERSLRASLQIDGEAVLIDHVQAEAYPERGSVVARLKRLSIEASIDEELIESHRRLVKDGFYAIIQLRFEENSSAARPFRVEALRPLESSGDDLMARFQEGRRAFSARGWIHFLAWTLGLDPFSEEIDTRAMNALLLRLVPLAEPNYHSIELGPRGTGKSYLYRNLSPRSRLMSEGKASLARLFVNRNTGKRGLVASQEAIAFDEIDGTSFGEEGLLSALTEYMESGSVNLGKMTVRGRASIVMLGNLDRPVGELLRDAHLFSPLPSPLKTRTETMDRICAFLPGWDVPKIGPSCFSDEIGLRRGFLAECLSRLRRQNREPELKKQVHLEGNLKGRDRKAVWKTMSGLAKLIFPDPETELPPEALRWACSLALEMRLRVRAQQHRIQPGEFPEGDFRFRIGQGGEPIAVCLPEEQ